MKYHRSWAQIEIALANAEYGYFFGPDASIDVAITTPKSGDTFDPGNAITIEATATDAEGTITKVDFYQNGIKLGTDTTAPYAFNWSNAAEGTYELTAIATNNSNISKTSSGVSLVVGNSAPVASFTFDPQEGSAPLPISVDASLSSDVDNDPLTYTWDFGDGTTGSGITATHTYSSAGNYTITLTVSDAQASDTDAATIEVTNIVREDIILTYKNGSSSTSDGEIKPVLKLQNIGTSGIPFEELTVKYWFTHETQENFGFNVDYAQVGSSNVIGTFTKNTPALDRATFYTEIGFRNAAGTLAPGTNSGEIQLRLVNQPWSNFNETNDFSFSNTINFEENTNITVYKNGKLIWGIEPSNEVLSTPEFDKYVFSVYPNPAKDVINITSDRQLKDAQISLIDLTGKIVKSIRMRATQNMRFAINQVAAGLYMIQIKDSNGPSQIKKIVIK